MKMYIMDDLIDYFKLSCEEADGYCSTSGKKNFLDWECNIAKPAMEAKGFTAISFYTHEGDSCGPLIRGVRCKDSKGTSCKFFYG